MTETQDKLIHELMNTVPQVDGCICSLGSVVHKALVIRLNLNDITVDKLTFH